MFPTKSLEYSRYKTQLYNFELLCNPSFCSCKIVAKTALSVGNSKYTNTWFFFIYFKTTILFMFFFIFRTFLFNLLDVSQIDFCVFFNKSKSSFPLCIKNKKKFSIDEGEIILSMFQNKGKN